MLQLRVVVIDLSAERLDALSESDWAVMATGCCACWVHWGLWLWQSHHEWTVAPPLFEQGTFATSSVYLVSFLSIRIRPAIGHVDAILISS